MKGIILAGGKATRLHPLTRVTSKQLLPVYDQPMIYYPLNTLVKAGIKDILIIVSPEYAGHFLNLLGDGNQYDVHITYAVQNEPRGLPDAFIVGKNFILDDCVTMILGDNIFDVDFCADISSFKYGARIFAKRVRNPKRYGVIEFDSNMNIKSLEEKPLNPKSNFVSIGLYIFDNRVVKVAESLTPSSRNELEILDIYKYYLEKKEVDLEFYDGFWEDAGTFDSLLNAGNYMSKFFKKLKK